ncbi:MULTISPECIES: transposase family protein [unclassified Cyanobium]|uniref:transposase family protein n=1 Tax=unclassified Cyanobium TaxID=2627006 RepID=UPI0020CCE57B|nr:MULTISPECIES: transposase family protein [unclassified Cyanobium]MCP9835637.1 transposase family protein [Cyanobium sp. La Preciosa 7G6]MCP9938403.1 transposase family protein [Cyanobium sp. Aljojuca 7A6]
MSKPASPSDLIGFLQSLPEGRKRRGVRYPQWLLLLMVAILGILSGCRSARDLERFARRHREAFNTALGLELRGTPTDSTFLYLLERVDLQSMFAMLRQWMLAQIAEQDRELDQLICDGKTLRGSASQPEGSDGATRFVTQVTLYARDLGVAYCFAEAWRLRPDLLRHR